GVRPRAQPADRAPDGRRGRLATGAVPSSPLTQRKASTTTAMAEAPNIPVGSATAGSIAVAAESTVATRMSAPPSFDVADFPVPHVREEEWRFTPLERLRGLHDGTATADGGIKVAVQAPEGGVVETVGRDDARAGRAGAPGDRAAAQADRAAGEAAGVAAPQGAGPSAAL